MCMVLYINYTPVKLSEKGEEGLDIVFTLEKGFKQNSLDGHDQYSDI